MMEIFLRSIFRLQNNHRDRIRIPANFQSQDFYSSVLIFGPFSEKKVKILHCTF